MFQLSTLWYSGSWKDDFKHRHGVQTYANGDKYSGSGNNGKLNGEGVLTSASGDVYSGPWKDDFRHGEAQCLENLKNRSIGLEIFSTDPYYKSKNSFECVQQP